MCIKFWVLLSVYDNYTGARLKEHYFLQQINKYFMCEDIKKSNLKHEERQRKLLYVHLNINR